MMNWEDAEAYCANAGRHLISIHSDEDQEAVEDLCSSISLSGSSGCWIGLTDPDGDGNWGMFQSISFSNTLILSNVFVLPPHFG